MDKEAKMGTIPQLGQHKEEDDNQYKAWRKASLPIWDKDPFFRLLKKLAMDEAEGGTFPNILHLYLDMFFEDANTGNHCFLHVLGRLFSFWSLILVTTTIFTKKKDDERT